MRKTILFAPALLSACSTAPAAPVVIHGEIPGHTCVEGAADSYIGKARNDATGKAIKAATHAAVLRWAPPGVMLTMDYRSDRVTVWVGPDNIITKLRCG